MIVFYFVYFTTFTNANTTQL